MRAVKFLILALALMPFGVYAQDGFEDFEDDEPAPVSQRPTTVDSSLLKKLSEARASKSEDALVSAASAILSINPSHKEALNALAVHYFEAKRYGLAKILLRRALKDHPDDPALHNNLGVIYLAEDEPRLALESFRKSVQSRADYRYARTNLASIYLEHRDYSRSLEPLEQSYRSTRSDLGRGADYAVEIANNYAVALMGLNQNSKAEDVFAEIAKSGTRNPVPYLNYAILLTSVLKKKNDALRVLSKIKIMTEDRGILRKVQQLEKRIEE